MGFIVVGIMSEDDCWMVHSVGSASRFTGSRIKGPVMIGWGIGLGCGFM
jgi:hypothetical protein